MTFKFYLLIIFDYVQLNVAAINGAYLHSTYYINLKNIDGANDDGDDN